MRRSRLATFKLMEREGQVAHHVDFAAQVDAELRG
jgi:hypothetical protein